MPGIKRIKDFSVSHQTDKRGETVSVPLWKLKSNLAQCTVVRT